jgi:photosystem II stability/assembly factor-like uncharacterized protein
MICLIGLALVVGPQVAECGKWRQQKVPCEIRHEATDMLKNDLWDVCFASAENGWIVGGTFGRVYRQGVIFHTVNGGQTWVEQSKGKGIEVADRFGAKAIPELYCVTCIGANNVWACGEEGAILFSSNGGVAWQVQPSGSKETLRCIRMRNAKSGWACGDKGTLLETSDRGITWAKRDMENAGDLKCLVILDSMKVIAVGSGIQITTDGGQHWSKPENSPGGLLSVTRTDSLSIWAVGENGTIAHSSDGGLTWKSHANGEWKFGDIGFADAKTGWIVGAGSSIINGYGALYKTTDGGETWNVDVQGGVIEETDKNGWTTEKESQIWRLQGLWVSKSKAACAVGFRGMVMRHSN